MTTTQEQAGVEIETTWDVISAWFSGLPEPTRNRISVEHLHRLSKRIDALRQPQAARLTEEEYTGALQQLSTALSYFSAIVSRHGELNIAGEAILDAAQGNIRRLTAAPAQQVTREEIARVIEDRVRLLKFDGQPIMEAPSILDAADAILSLPALRGLVKGA